VEDVKAGIRRTLKLFPPERLWIYPDCGPKTRTTDEAEAKLQVMVDAVSDIKHALEIETRPPASSSRLSARAELVEA